ncbi:MAG: hypothetical protein GQ531_06555 [Sulfurovum sp.]|nr:hypothetical protein [Sulfurovum sp.]
MRTYRENKWFHSFLLNLLLVLGLMFGLSSQAFAANGPEAIGLFELDGDIKDDIKSDITLDGDDWQNIVEGTSGAFSSTEGGILHDGLKKSIFIGGGSKDIRDIPLWKWTNGSVPDKDEIINAAAAAYNHNGELIIYMMGDRFSIDGSAQMGIWFFQENVKMNTDTGKFDGKHKNGDILMLAEFTKGGVQANIKLYKWDDSQKNNLNLLFDGTGDESDDFYAISNGVSTPALSGYSPKSGPAGYYPPNAFFEGGLNVSAIFGGSQNLPCFSSFLMETRSSHRETAQLKDFVVGELNTCKLAITKTCLSSEVVPGAYTSLLHTYKYTLTNSGFGAIDSVTLRDDAGTPIIETDDFDLPEVLDLGMGAEVNATYTHTSTKNPPTNTIYATGHIGEFTMEVVSAEATCQKVILSPSIIVDKKCKQTLEARNGHVVVRIDYQGEVCNDENGTLLNDVWVTDDVSLESFGPFTLYPEDHPLETGEVRENYPYCADYSSIYYPSETVKACAHNSSHSNTVTATGTSALGQTDVNTTATATCKLCDSGNCTEPTSTP